MQEVDQKTIEQWIDANPKGWKDFCRIADKKRETKSKWSTRACIHKMRWEQEDRGEKPMRIANYITPGLARKYNAMVGMPFFTTRPSKFDKLRLYGESDVPDQME